MGGVWGSMMNNKCPHCDGAAMGVLQKATRGFWKNYECDSCGRMVRLARSGIAWRVVALVVALVVAIGSSEAAMAADSAMDDTTNFLLFVVTFIVVAAATQILFVPVVAVDAPVSQGGQPAAWHPDPTGRHELRYWNGFEWSETVSDGGVESQDPVT
jgi:hypothetical protein